MVSHETLNKAINLITEHIDARQVMWQLTHDDLEVVVDARDRYLYHEWIIKERDHDDYHFFARIETNTSGKLFTLTVRASYLPFVTNEILEDAGFHKDGYEFLFDTNSPMQVLGALDLAISYKC